MGSWDHFFGGGFFVFFFCGWGVVILEVFGG